MALGLSILVALSLVTATVVLHYELLQFAGTLPQRLPFPTRARMIVVIAVVLAAHVIEASLYAVAYYMLQTHAAIGGLAGHLEGDLLDFFYFSMATYTTLGIGDVHPSGMMRLIAGVESLNGLVLIGYTILWRPLELKGLTVWRAAAERPTVDTVRSTVRLFRWPAIDRVR